VIGEGPNALREYPDLEYLMHGLQSALGVREGLQVVKREPMRRPHTFPGEVVICRLADGRELALFCKYQKGNGPSSHGHRGGLDHEADVYKRVLAHSSSPTPQFYGSYRNGDTGETWLVIEYIAGAQRVLDTTAPERRSWTPEAGAMPLAARWLGGFHAEYELRWALGRGGTLRVYDTDYYQGWARRTALIASTPTVALPWVVVVCDRAVQALAVLEKGGQTLIHGEFYAGNVLVRGGVIYPVDWESAAVGAGEVDLAALIEHWPDEIANQCKDAYVAARYPQGQPLDFEPRLRAARLYLHLRWLGERQDWTTDKRLSWRLKDLRALAAQLGLND
jgi:aminoglycoside phosphotransferase (APT) family kinase protein